MDEELNHVVMKMRLMTNTTSCRVTAVGNQVGEGETLDMASVDNDDRWCFSPKKKRVQLREIFHQLQPRTIIGSARWNSPTHGEAVKSSDTDEVEFLRAMKSAQGHLPQGVM